jgi:hypothetical protein
MELDRSHIGKLVQLITDSWSMTGTLKRVDQHDNREWEIAYPSRQLVPVRGEIYATLHIGPWVGDVIGNQPVTVETVAGTLEAPETATKAVTHLITEEESAEARAIVRRDVNAHRHQAPSGQMYWCYEQHQEDPPAIEGTVVEPDPEPPSKSGYVVPERVALAMTEPGYLDWSADQEDLPPEPPAEWRKADRPEE